MKSISQMLKDIEAELRPRRNWFEEYCEKQKKFDQPTFDAALKPVNCQETRKAAPQSRVILPRVIRFRDASHYLGMDRNRFNNEVRPFVTETRIGRQGVAFDRLELEAWFDQYKQSNGRPGKTMEGGSSWGKESRQGSLKEGTRGTSKRQSGVIAFEKALARVTSRKRNDT